MPEVKPNYLTEMSNSSATINNPTGFSAEEIAAFVSVYGEPTTVTGRFGQRMRNPNGIDAESLARFLSRDSSWFPTPEPEEHNA